MDKKANGEINWAETILLPNTEFPMRANLPNAEPSFLNDWNDIDIYAKNREINRLNIKNFKPYRIIWNFF